jgi:hypothetical protein
MEYIRKAPPRPKNSLALCEPPRACRYALPDAPPRTCRCVLPECHHTPCSQSRRTAPCRTASSSPLRAACSCHLGLPLALSSRRAAPPRARRAAHSRRLKLMLTPSSPLCRAPCHLALAAARHLKLPLALSSPLRAIRTAALPRAPACTVLAATFCPTRRPMLAAACCSSAVPPRAPGRAAPSRAAAMVAREVQPRARELRPIFAFA